MKTILRLLFFWIKVIAVVLIIVAIAGCSFFIAMDVVNLTILVKDGMALRANVVFAPEDYDAEELTKFFTAEYLATDTFLQDDTYRQYEIDDYDYDTKVERVWCWPWQNKVTMVISCRQYDLDGALREEYMTQEQIEAGEKIEPPKLENTRYRVHCERIDDKWTITDLEFVETFEEESLQPQKEEETAQPETSPQTQDSAQQEQTQQE
jgi:hypothetical protein